MSKKPPYAVVGLERLPDLVGELLVVHGWGRLYADRGEGYDKLKAHPEQGKTPLILLTRLDNSKILVNLESIKFIESTPDTLVVFLNGDSLIVRESLEEIDARVLSYRHKLLAHHAPTSPSSASPAL
jgi:flagellar protein FlbD